jgi:hypothetical protein
MIQTNTSYNLQIYHVISFPICQVFFYPFRKPQHSCLPHPRGHPNSYQDENVVTRVSFVLVDVRFLSKSGKIPIETILHIKWK